MKWSACRPALIQKHRRCQKTQHKSIQRAAVIMMADYHHMASHSETEIFPPTKLRLFLSCVCVGLCLFPSLGINIFVVKACRFLCVNVCLTGFSVPRRLTVHNKDQSEADGAFLDDLNHLNVFGTHFHSSAVSSSRSCALHADRPVWWLINILSSSHITNRWREIHFLS